MSYRNITPSEVKAKIDSGEKIRLIDVREPNEHAVARIEGAELLPLSRNAEWIGTLPQDEAIIVFCHHGGRSAQVANHLSNQGHNNVANMAGGIEEWSLKIDQNVPRY